MKTFPIKDEKWGSTFKTFYHTKMLPNFCWGEKLYMEYEGKLRAVKPLYAALVYPTKPASQCDGERTLVCFNIAGIGEKLIKWEVYWDDRRVKLSQWNNRIFKTTEDYDRFIGGEKGTEYIPDAVFLSDILRVHGYTRLKEHCCWEYEVIGWCWNYEEPRECPMSFRDVWIDKGGGHVTVIHQGWGKPEYPAYLTREECLEANRKEVVDFDEEDQGPDGVMNTTNGHNPELVARINRAWNMHQTWWEFTLIVSALMHRDGSSILEMLGKEIAEYDDDEKMVVELGPEYLQIIADDADLQTILNFISLA